MARTVWGALWSIEKGRPRQLGPTGTDDVRSFLNGGRLRRRQRAGRREGGHDPIYGLCAAAVVSSAGDKFTGGGARPRRSARADDRARVGRRLEIARGPAAD